MPYNLNCSLTHEQALERKEAEIVAQNFQDTSDNLMYSTNKCDLLTSEKKKLNMILTEREAELTDTKLVKNEVFHFYFNRAHSICYLVCQLY